MEYTNKKAVYIIRTFHLSIGAFFTAAIFYIWYSAIFNAVTFWTWIAIAAHIVEAVILIANHGVCPMGPLHHYYGDEKTMFELVAGKSYAKIGMKVWWFFFVVGTAFVIFRTV